MSKDFSCDDCPYRADGKCIGPDICLHESDDWIQERVRTKLFFQQKKGETHTNAKAAHKYFHALKLSEIMGANREAFLDNLVNARKKCAFEKTGEVLGVLDRLPDESDDPNAILRD